MSDKLIYIAEDDAELRHAYDNLIPQIGYAVKTYENGELLLNSLEDKFPDLIILDLIMPVMDGFTTLHNLKDNSLYSDIPVIICSNIGSPREINRVLGMGADCYILKTEFTLEGVKEMIQSLIGD